MLLHLQQLLLLLLLAVIVPSPQDVISELQLGCSHLELFLPLACRLLLRLRSDHRVLELLLGCEHLGPDYAPAAPVLLLKLLLLLCLGPVSTSCAHCCFSFAHGLLIHASEHLLLLLVVCGCPDGVSAGLLGKLLRRRAVQLLGLLLLLLES